METTGLVQQLALVTVPPTRGGCAWIGAAPWDAELFILQTQDSDTEAEREHANSMLRALETALAGRITVTVQTIGSSNTPTNIYLHASGTT